tara:strand:- start:2928 stop:3821 length:894 start_codon:yes stop_codon:yes gene_type:complete
MENNNEEAIEQIENEIVKAKEDPNNFEIEVTDEPQKEDFPVAEAEEKAEKQEDFGPKVERRIKKLVNERRESELESKKLQEQNAQLEARLARLEQGSQQNDEKAFNQRYSQTKAALTKAVEEGDTEAQVNFQEQMADMRAAMRIAEMQKQQKSQQAVSPTVGRAQQQASTPPPPKAMDWWQKNRWFNADGYERESAAARAIDVQLDLEGYDKHGDDYYDSLNNRLQKMFPELISGESKSKTKIKSRIPVAPTAGGSTYKGNRVRISQDQLRMARELGITDEKALKQYANEIQKSNRS